MFTICMNILFRKKKTPLNLALFKCPLGHSLSWCEMGRDRDQFHDKSCHNGDLGRSIFKWWPTRRKECKRRSSLSPIMVGGDEEGDGDHFDGLKGKDPEAEERAELLKDRFRLSVISIATSEGACSRCPTLAPSPFHSLDRLFHFDFWSFVRFQQPRKSIWRSRSPWLHALPI